MATKQQEFDGVMALLSEGVTSREKPIFSLLTEVRHLDHMIDDIDEIRDLLIKAKKASILMTCPEEIKVRLGDLLPLNPNTKHRAGVPVMTPVEDPKPTRSRLTQKDQVMRLLTRVGGLTTPNIGRRLHISSTAACKLVYDLRKEGRVKRRKLRPSERASAQAKYLYEVKS